MPLSALLLFLVIGALLGAVIVSGFALFEWSLPVTPWTMSLMLAVLGVAAAWRARWLTRQYARPETRPDPRVGVVSFATARSATLIGLLLAGGHLSYVAWQLGRLDVDLYRERAVQGGLAVLGSLVMVAGAQLLERACKVPDDPEGDADQA